MRGQQTFRRFEQQLKDQGVDFILFLEPWEVFATESLYVCINWDLAHYEDPYFPEIITKVWETTARKSKVLGTSKGDADHQWNERVVGAGSPARACARRRECACLPFPTPKDALGLCDEANRRAGKDTLCHKACRGRYLFYPASFWPHKNHVNAHQGQHTLLRGTEDEYDIGVLRCEQREQGAMSPNLTRELGDEGAGAFFRFPRARKEVLELYCAGRSARVPLLDWP